MRPLSTAPSSAHLQNWTTRVQVVLNVDLVGATTDPEVAVHAPGSAPTVGTDPVGHTGCGIRSPTNNSDGMTELQRAIRVRVHTGLVVQEVRVDVVGGMDRTIGHDVAHHRSQIGLAESCNRTWIGTVSHKGTGAGASTGTALVRCVHTAHVRCASLSRSSGLSQEGPRA